MYASFSSKLCYENIQYIHHLKNVMLQFYLSSYIYAKMENTKQLEMACYCNRPHKEKRSFLLVRM